MADSILPESEKLRRAIRWLSDERLSRPAAKSTALLDEASLRFDLTPAEAEWLAHMFADVVKPR
jgi:hypothetical protein